MDSEAGLGQKTVLDKIGFRRGGGLQNHKYIGYLCNTGLDPLKNHKATKPAFNVGPSSARQRNAFRWLADDGPPHLSIVGSSFLHQLKNKK